MNPVVWRLVVTAALALAGVPGQAAELAVRGAWTQGGMIVGQVAPVAKVWLGRKAVAVGRDGHFILGLDRDAPREIELTVSDPLGEQRYRFAVARRDYPVQRVDGVPARTVTPPAEMLARIRREQEWVDRARAEVSARQDFLAGFTRPLQGPITGVYGSTRIYNGVPRNPHFGLDIAAPTGALVRAPAAGVVRLAQPDLYFSGGTLIVDHGQGLSSTFMHLSALLVGEGEELAPGDPIARVGATGRATGPHLDWRMNWRDVRVDPALVLDHFPSVKAAATGSAGVAADPQAAQSAALVSPAAQP